MERWLRTCGNIDWSELNMLTDCLRAVSVHRYIHEEIRKKKPKERSVTLTHFGVAIHLESELLR